MALRNRHDESHTIAATVSERDDGQTLFQAEASLDPDEDAEGSFTEPGDDVPLAVSATLDGGTPATAELVGEERADLDNVNVTVFDGESLNIGWATNVEQ